MELPTPQNDFENCWLADVLYSAFPYIYTFEEPLLPIPWEPDDYR